jgi:hypothetical protein
MRISRNATANGESVASASRTALTAASAPSQNTGAKAVLRPTLLATSAGGRAKSRSRKL